MYVREPHVAAPYCQRIELRTCESEAQQRYYLRPELAPKLGHVMLRSDEDTCGPRQPFVTQGGLPEGCKVKL